MRFHPSCTAASVVKCGWAGATHLSLRASVRVPDNGMARGLHPLKQRVPVLAPKGGFFKAGVMPLDDRKVASGDYETQ